MLAVYTLYYIIQVAALAPLVLLLVLEARCAHFVIAHFNYCVLWSSASLAPTQHIYKLVSEHYHRLLTLRVPGLIIYDITVIAMGVVPMSKVEGSWIQHLPTSNPHAHAHHWYYIPVVGSKVSAHSATG